MSTESNNIHLVKVSKEEQNAEKEATKRKKEEMLNRIPEQDREKKKVYKKKIIETLILFVVALGLLALIATGIISTTIGLVGLAIIAAISTYISRKDQ